MKQWPSLLYATKWPVLGDLQKNHITWPLYSFTSRGSRPSARIFFSNSAIFIA